MPLAIGRIFEEMAELNADQEYTYSDEELIEMLNAATAAQRSLESASLLLLRFSVLVAGAACVNIEY